MTEFSNKGEYAEGADFDYKESGGWKEKFWDFIGGKYFVPIVIILIAVIAFSLGKTFGLQEKRPEVKIINEAQTNSASVNKPQNTAAAASAVSTSQSAVQTVVSPVSSGGQVVASRNGTKYHYPWCAGAKQISAKNLVTYSSIEEARAAGLTPAANCKGLK